MKKQGTKTIDQKNKQNKKQSPFRVFCAVFLTVLAMGTLTLLGIAALTGRAGSLLQENTLFAEGAVSVQGGVSEQVLLAENSADEEIKEGILLRSESGHGQDDPEAAEAGETEPADLSKYGALLADQEAMQQINAVKADTEDAERVTIAFAGDILFDDNYTPMVTLKMRGGDITSCFSDDLLDEMAAADIFFLNNEFTYTTRGVPLADKQYTFRARPEYTDYLKDLSVDAVSLANNHSYDYGEISLTDTLDTLEEAGIPYVGAGRNIEEASKPLVFVTEELRIAVVSASQIERNTNPHTRGATENSPGVFRCFDPEQMYETVRQAKQENDFVIVYIHWGTENTAELDWAQRDQAIGLAEAGADLIIGDHPHCLQEAGYVNGVPVLYSLGNYWFNSRALDTCLVKAVVTTEGLESLQFLPARQENCYTKLLSGSEADRVIGYMNGLSGTAVLDEAGYIHER